MTPTTTTTDPGDESPAAPAGFESLMAGLRRGDEGAASAVYAHSARRLTALAQARLGHRLAGKEDPEEVVQSAYRSFFRRYRGGRYEVSDWDDVWALLAAIAARKCANRRAYYQAARRDARREEGGGPAAAEPADPGPSPVDSAVLAETVERLLRGLEPPERAVVELSLEGYGAREISARLGRSERTVQRVRQYVRRLLERGAADDATS